MFKISKSENELVIKQNSLFWVTGIGSVFMSVSGIRLLFELLSPHRGYEAGDIFGIIFMCVWVSVALGIGFFSVVTATKSIIINSEGVISKTIVTKKQLCWYEIKDWGFSYCGETRGEGDTYYLYFSDHECKVKNERTKKLKGKMIKAFVIGEEYYDVASEIIYFCSARTAVKPFAQSVSPEWYEDEEC